MMTLFFCLLNVRHTRCVASVEKASFGETAERLQNRQSNEHERRNPVLEQIAHALLVSAGIVSAGTIGATALQAEMAGARWSAAMGFALSGAEFVAAGWLVTRWFW